MAQLLLIPDARPLEQRLGREFFRKTPRRPGVYLMKDAAENVVYVGKAKDLRQRLSNYRVANPDRMPRRHLRMVQEVKRIEFQLCPNECAALAREAKLLRSLKPKFNRAGVWPGKARFLAWRIREDRLEITVLETPEPDWQRFGPLGSHAFHLQRTLARLLWLAFNPTRGLADLPAGWVHGRFMDLASGPAAKCPLRLRRGADLHDPWLLSADASGPGVRERAALRHGTGHRSRGVHAGDRR